VFVRPPRSILCVLVLALLAAGCREEGDILIKDLSFHGVRSVDEGRLKGVLATKESAWLPFGRKRYFVRNQFDEDLKRIKAFYADRGFPDAKVTSVDVDLNDRQDQVRISITIDEGQPVRVASLAFEGFDVVPEDHRRALEARAPTKVGAPLDRQHVVATREMAANELKDHGFPYAVVELNPEAVAALTDPASQAVSVPLVFQGVPGTKAFVGPVEISGNQSVGDDVIRRQLLFRPGDVFRQGQVRQSQRRLYGMELFEFANVEIVEGAQQPAEVPIRVTVTEGKHRKFNFGAGYGTEEKARVDGHWSHVNFFGGARTAGVHARWSSLERGVRLTFNQPYFFSPRVSFGADLQEWFLREPAYSSDIYGGRGSITYHVSEQTQFVISVINELEQSTISDEALQDPSIRDELIALGLDPRTGMQRGTLGAIAVSFNRNTTPNIIDASRGYLLSLQVESAGRLLPGNYNYMSISGEGRYYVTIGGWAVLAGRAQYGTVDPQDGLDSNVPFSRRYFLGGSTSMRGWGRFEVSPLSGSGLPLGGLTIFQATAEVRAPIVGGLAGVVFLDAGNVWATAWASTFRDLRYDVGPGLRYMTPIGPLRVDIGYQLNPIPGLITGDGEPQKRAYRVHFSIGQAF
jgi:outer membrane protein insertion porin family